MIIREISWEEIKFIWERFLWPKRATPIEPTSAMVFKGGYDMNNMKETPFFLGAFIDDLLVGVNSGHRTSKALCRSRGLWVDEAHRRQGIAQALLEETINIACNQGCIGVWTFPRKSSLPAYENVGFVKCSDWINDGEFGPNCYAEYWKEIGEP